MQQGRAAESLSVYAKRLLDLGVALTGLVLLAPFLFVLATVIRISLGPPVFYRQKRPGLKGRSFDFTKFRTMSEERDQAGNLLPDADRLTALGRLLRKTSLDEVPTLWHVVRGEMSLVGPRPLLMQYLELYTEEQARRHDVLPGITGWAQIHGRNAISWEEKLALDVWYVDHWSFSLDLKILAATIPTLIKREGIGHAGAATMPEFTGSNSIAEMKE